MAAYKVILFLNFTSHRVGIFPYVSTLITMVSSKIGDMWQAPMTTRNASNRQKVPNVPSICGEKLSFQNVFMKLKYSQRSFPLLVMRNPVVSTQGTILIYTYIEMKGHKMPFLETRNTQKARLAGYEAYVSPPPPEEAMLVLSFPSHRLPLVRS